MSNFDLNSLGAPVVSASPNKVSSSSGGNPGSPYRSDAAYAQHVMTSEGQYTPASPSAPVRAGQGYNTVESSQAGAPGLIEQEHSTREGVPTTLRPNEDTASTTRARDELIAHVQDPHAGIDHHQTRTGTGYSGSPVSANYTGSGSPAYSSANPNDTSAQAQPHAAAVQHGVHVPGGDKFSSLSAIGAGGGARPNEDTVIATDVRTRTNIIPSTTSQQAANVPSSVNDSSPNSNTNTANTTTLPTAPTVHPAAQARELSKKQHEDPQMVAREVEKAKAGQREVEGEMPKGTIVEGIEDDRLWALLRRFDVQVTHAVISMSHTSTAHADEPDLRRSTLPSIPYNNDVLRSNIERMYSTLGIVAIRTFNEITRLRSWSPQERVRTGSFAAVYFIAWAFGLAIPTLLAFIIILVVSEESRMFFFPPMLPPEGTPPSATDPRNEKGDESLMGGVDSEVAHRSRTEQIEEQAWEFRQLAEGFAVKMAVAKGDGRRKQGNAEVGKKNHYTSDTSSSSSSNDDDDLVPGPGGIDPSLYAPGEHPAEVKAAHKRSQANNGMGPNDDDEDNHDTPQGKKGKTRIVKRKDGTEVEKPLSDKERKKVEAREAKAKRDALISKSLKMLQDGMGDTADFIECLANAMSPPPPFPPTLARYKLAGGILVPIMIATAVIPAWIWAKAGSFALGFGFFGQPLIDRGTEELLRLLEKVPDWREYLDLRNSLLSGVPTNDQLVLHLLRVGERANSPLPRPPAPPLAGTPKEAIKDTAPHPDDGLVDSDGEPISVDDLKVTDKVKHKAKSGIVGAFKGLSKRVAAIGADVTVDGVKKKIGTRVDRVVFGGLLEDDGDNETYPCRIDKKLGHLFLEPTANTGGPAIVSFKGIHDLNPLFERSVNDLVEIKKGGVSVPRAVLGWMSGADIESQTLLLRFLSRNERRRNKLAREQGGEEPEEGQVYEIHSMVRREQAFVRLLSMGSSQRWESI